MSKIIYNLSRWVPCCLAAVLLSCTSDWEKGPSPQSPSPDSLAIAFGATAATSQPQTRADGTIVNKNETTLPATDSNHDYYVGLFGYYTGQGSWNGEQTADIFYNQKMTVLSRQGDANPLTYSPLRFWPNNDGDKMSFWAYYPWNATDDPGDYGVAISSSSIGKGKGMGSIKFTMHPDASAQSDFMISDLRADQTKPTLETTSVDDGLTYSPKRVSLRFRHMLAQVRLYAFIRGVDKMVYQTVKVDGNEVEVVADATWLDAQETVTTDGNPTIIDEWGNKYWKTTDNKVQREAPGGYTVLSDEDFVALNLRVPDEEKCERWDRTGGVWDVTGQRRRANISYSMSFNNIHTTCVFTPKFENNTTTFNYEDQGALGSATVDHYIMNPYWFHFDDDGQRDHLNETYMYGYFEGTKAYTLTGDDDGSNRTWSSQNQMGYQYEVAGGYNYAPGNIILAVPQVMNDSDVPNVTIIATGKTTQNGVTKDENQTATVTINLLGMALKWESGFIYSYAFLEDNLHPGDDLVRGPGSIVVYFDPQKWTDQW